MSWRLGETLAPDVTAAVMVVADPFVDSGRAVASITLRLTVPSARVHVSVDGRPVASIELSCSLPEPESLRGHLFRDEAILPLDLLDGRTHLVEVAVDTEERVSLAKLETAFYARRVLPRDSRRAGAARVLDELGEAPL